MNIHYFNSGFLLGMPDSKHFSKSACSWGDKSDVSSVGW